MNPSTLWAELKRRRVVRVAGAYAVVAWLLVEIAATVFPVLRLPDWTVTLVVALAALGLPIAVMLAWAYEVTPEGLRRDDAAAASTPRASGAALFADRKVRRTGVAVLVLLLAVGGWLALPSRSSPTAASPTAIAVFPFSVRGSGEFAYLSEGMVTLLARKLDGAGSLRTVNARAVLGAAAQDEGAAEPGRARAIALDLGAGLYIVGDIVEAAGRLHVEAALHDPDAGAEPLATASREGDADELFGLVDALAADLLAGLSRGPSGRIARLAAVTTSSLDALKAYLEGERQLRTGDPDSAVTVLQRAIDLDSTFAVAYYRLAMAHMARGTSEEVYHGYLAEAARRADRLPERDLMLLQASSAWAGSTMATPEARYHEILARYPDDVEAWFWLAELLFHNNPWRGEAVAASREAWQRVLGFEPTNRFAFMHLARVAAISYDHALLDSLARPFVGRAEGDRRTLEVTGHRAIAMGDTAEQSRLAEQLRRLPGENALAALQYLGAMSRNPSAVARVAASVIESWPAPAHRAEGHILLAFLHLAGGRREDATTELLRAESLSPERGRIHRALAAALPMVAATEEERRIARGALGRELPGGPEAKPYGDRYPVVRLYLAGLLDLALGDYAAAAARADTLELLAQEDDESAFARARTLALRAHHTAATGRAADALALLAEIPYPALAGNRPMAPFEMLDRWLQAELLARLGRGEEALRWYASLAQTTPEEIALLAPATLRRAQLEEDMGRPERARVHYARFLDLWDEGDPGVRAVVEDARRRLERLTGEAGALDLQAPEP